MHSTDHGRLKKKADYFFAESRTRRREVAAFARSLVDLGPTVAIGGMLRDVHLCGLRRFRSDVDFVVDPGSMREFETFAARSGAERNRFGGYGISLDHWNVDVWPLERTWAAVNRHRNVTSLSDLLDVTFFDWDAILYRLDTRQLLHRPDYFQAIASRRIDVNLPQNPNPTGNAVRALRYARRFDAALGPTLADHVLRCIRDDGWQALVDSERRGFATHLLKDVDCDVVVERLRGDATLAVKPFDPPQAEFLFEGADARAATRPAPGGAKARRRSKTTEFPRAVGRRNGLRSADAKPYHGELAFG